VGAKGKLTARIQSQSWWTSACEGAICVNTCSSSSANPNIQVTFIYIGACLSIHLYNITNMINLQNGNIGPILIMALKVITPSAVALATNSLVKTCYFLE
jgi:hypothetical protein